MYFKYSLIREKIHQLLQEKGIESSLPLIKTIRIWSNRKKKVELPLFKGYVFVYIDIKKDKYNLLKTDVVVKIIALNKATSRVPSQQMHWLNIMVKASDAIRHETTIPVGFRKSVLSSVLLKVMKAL